MNSSGGWTRLDKALAEKFNHRQSALIIFFVAFIVRLLPVCFLPYNNAVGGVGDAAVGIAVSFIKDGQLIDGYKGEIIHRAIVENRKLSEVVDERDPAGHVTARNPLYSLVIASVVRIRGSLGLFPLQIIQIGVDSLAAVLIFKLMLLWLPAGVSFLCALAYALWPPAIQFSFTIHDGAFSSCLYVAILYLLAKGFARGQLTIKTMAGAAALTGVTYYLRPDTQFLAPFVAIVLCLCARISWGTRMKLFFTYCLVLGMTIASWAVRNYRYYGRAYISAPLASASVFEGLGNFPQLFSEYRNMNNDSAVCPFAHAHGYGGDCSDVGDKNTQIKLGAFYSDYIRNEIMLKHPVKFVAFYGLKWGRYFFAHRHMTLAGSYLGLPVGSLRTIGIGSLFDFILTPFSLLFSMYIFRKERFFWILFLFPALFMALEAFNVLNELRYTTSGTFLIPCFVVVSAMVIARRLHRSP